jgi:hypothetical protein
MAEQTRIERGKNKTASFHIYTHSLSFSSTDIIIFVHIDTDINDMHPHTNEGSRANSSLSPSLDAYRRAALRWMYVRR